MNISLYTVYMTFFATALISDQIQVTFRVWNSAVPIIRVERGQKRAASKLSIIKRKTEKVYFKQSVDRQSHTSFLWDISRYIPRLIASPWRLFTTESNYYTLSLFGTTHGGNKAKDGLLVYILSIPFSHISNKCNLS